MTSTRMCEYVQEHLHRFRIGDALRNVTIDSRCELIADGDSSVTVRLSNKSRTAIDRLLASVHLINAAGARFGQILHYNTELRPPLAIGEQREIRFHLSSADRGAKSCEESVSALPSRDAVRQSTKGH